jgi:hypothetical protein
MCGSEHTTPRRDSVGNVLLADLYSCREPEARGMVRRTYRGEDLTMSAQELHALLSRLHAQLQGSPQLDEESRQLLRELGVDLARLRQGAGAASGDGALGDAAAAEGSPGAGAAHASRFDALVGRFEGAHPSLAASLREMADALARAGL